MNVTKLKQVADKNRQLFIEQTEQRKEFLDKLDYMISVIKCMDGRASFMRFVMAMLGTMMPFREKGGALSLSWRDFYNEVFKTIARATWFKKEALFIITYHYSLVDKKLGCAAFNYDTEAALTYALNLKKDFDEKFGSKLKTVVVGMNTDNGALRFHNGFDYVDIAEHSNLESRFYELFKEEQVKLVKNLLFLAIRNKEYLNSDQNHNVQSGIDHQEHGIAVGRGLWSISDYNNIFTIGPFNPNRREPVEVAAKLLLSNIESGRIKPDDGIIIIGSSFFGLDGNSSDEKVAAEAIALNRAYETLEIIKSSPYKIIAEKAQLVTTVLNAETFELMVKRLE